VQVTHDRLWIPKQLSATLEGGFTLQRSAHRGVAGWTTRALWVIGGGWEGVSTFFLVFFYSLPLFTTQFICYISLCIYIL
jgi:hypothetical protein